MGSRLDRLVALLEGGSTPALRRQAADQLGQIAAQHGAEALRLLNRAAPLLRDRRQDARTAAAWAVDAVVAAAPAWPPDQRGAPALPKGAAMDIDIKEEPGMTLDSKDDPLAALAPSTMLAQPHLLAASAASFVSVGAAPSLQEQRAAVDKELGIEHSGVEVVGESDLIDPNAPPQPSAPPAKAPAPTKVVASSGGAKLKIKIGGPKTEPVAPPAPQSAAPATEGLSVRQQLMAKKKAKLEVTKLGTAGASNAQAGGPASPNPDPTTPLAPLPPPLPSAPYDPYTCSTHPLFPLLNQLVSCLGNQRWESRHGACLGLRALLTKGAAFGFQFPSSDGEVDFIFDPENAKRHARVCSHIATDLLRLLAADRFADFAGTGSVTSETSVSVGAVTAPVRDACAGALAALCSPKAGNAPSYIVRRILDLLLGLLQQAEEKEWHPKHAALLALRFILGHARPDLLDPVYLYPIFASLADPDDEVRGSAAAAVSAFLRAVPTCLDFMGTKDLDRRLLKPVWDALALADDLSGSAAPLLDLLATLLPKQPPSSRSASPLYPFLRHSSSQVRLATVRCFASLNPPPDAVAARLLLQSMVLETNKAVLRATSACFPRQVGPWASEPGLLKLWTLVMTPPGTALDRSLFLAAPGPRREEAVAMHDRPALEADPSLDASSVLLGRVLAASALGNLLAAAPVAHAAELERFLRSGVGYQRCAAGWVAASAFASAECGLWDAVMGELGADVLYSEQIVWLGALRRACVPAATMLGISMPSLPTGAEGEWFDEHWVRAALLPALQGNPQLLQVEAALARYSLDAEGLHARVAGSLAEAVVASKKLPEKVTPVVRSVVNCVRIEADEELQNRAAKAVAGLLPLVSAKAADKMVENLGTYLCEDTVACPKVDGQGGIVTLAKWTRDGAEDAKRANRPKEEVKEPKEAKEPPLKKQKRSKSPPPKSAVPAVESVDPFLASLAEPTEDVEKARHSISSRGGEVALAEIARTFGGDVFERIPRLWDVVSSGLAAFSDPSKSEGLARLASDSIFAQQVVGNVFALGKLVPYLEGAALARILALLPAVSNLLECPLAVVRYVVAQCLASFADSATLPTMQHVIARVLPLLGDTTSIVSRQAGAEAVYHIVDKMQLKVLPYLIFLVIPVLKRISDPEPSVRFLCTHNFATLVKLMPLEQGAPDPEGLDPMLVAQKREERRFIGQLIGTEQVEDFEIPDRIVKAELRRYQQEGINWLAFLARYGMHGILCDDMGLGKTLQTISIVASNHHLRVRRYRETGAPDAKHIPTLVVAPTTVVGHWYYEIKNFTDVLSPIMYIGQPAARGKLRSKLADHDVVITSYDIVRNDLPELSKFSWNYIVLDEGHLIRNTKAKLTQAVKSLTSNHRLILSGTPIQNNALELWSLFDFLMPGFLGTEQQFNERYSKPILASRDAKASTKEQEAGTLALDALHRQVLPFLLRRLKQDVLNDLPPKIIQDYYSDLGEVQRILYEDFARSRAKNDAVQDVEGSMVDSGKKGAGMHVFQALQYLRKLVNHPSLVLSPQHPEFTKIQGILNKSKTNLRDLQHAPKLLALQELLLDLGIGAREQSGTGDAKGEINDGLAVASHRALIFCQLKPMLDIIENDLFKTHMPDVTYMRLDGGVDATKRQELVRKFNDDPSIDVLLLTTHVGGLGLNLTGADTVIFVEHDWNPMKDLQAMDRAHRIGQKRKVNVYRLITRNTLEEKIMGLQRFKLNIANAIVNEENVGLKSMLGDAEQVLDLFAVSEPKAVKDKSQGDRKMTQKEILDSMDQWDEAQATEEQYETTDFLSKLR